MPKLLEPGERGSAKAFQLGRGQWRARGSIKLPDGTTYRGDQRGATRAMALAKLSEELDRAMERAGSAMTRTGVWVEAWMAPRVEAAHSRATPLPRGEKSRWSPGTARVYQDALRNLWPESAPEVRETGAGELDRRRADRSQLAGVGEAPLGLLTAESVETLYDSLIQPGGPGYRAAELVAMLLRRALDDAVAEGHLPRNPAVDARLPRRDDLDEDLDDLAALDGDTIRSVYRALTEYQQRARVAMWGGGPRYTDVWTLLAGSGARIGEIMALRLQDALVDEGRMV